MKREQVYYYILHLLAGVTIGFLLFSCKTEKSSCDAYANRGYKYCIEGYVMHQGDSCEAIALTDYYTTTNDSVFYFNSDSSLQTLYSPYKIYENKSRK